MPRAVANKTYRTFVKGLITEAGPLTYPENASLDEDNCILYRKGNRSRRLGFDYETDYVLNDLGVALGDFDNYAYQEYKWESVANLSDVNYLVQQVGLTLYFYDMSVEPLSDGLEPFTVDLTPFVTSGATTPELCQVAMTSGKGLLFVAGSKFEPFYVQYDEGTGFVAATRIYIQIRDFKGVDDGLANDEEPTTLSELHQYNLMNQGWFEPSNSGAGGTVSYFDRFGSLNSYDGPDITPITDYYTEFGRYPPNSKQWWLGKNSTTNNFNPNFIERYYTGNNRAPAGHYILDAFNKDRSAMSGVANIPAEVETERPPTITFYSGRVWYGLNSDIYYSQVIDSKNKAGFCYQEADPTSEDVSDIIATDGGMLPIPEMGKVVKLFPAGAGVMVFATNGIWYITGTTSGFSATDVSVSKIGPIGTESPNSVVEAEGQIFWWSKIGVQAMNPKSGLFGPIDGSFEKVNISELTIQSFYTEDIPEDAKPYVKGIYDPATNTIHWLFRDSTVTGNYQYNRILNYDITLQAFYPWTLGDSDPKLVGAFTTPRLNDVGNSTKTFAKFLCTAPNGTFEAFTFGGFDNTNFCDWESYDGTGVAYTSYIETGYEILEDIMRKKQTPVVYTYFRRTEENYVETDVDGVYETDKPSSCYFQVKWDWASSSTSNKWSTKVQAYRHRRIPTLDEDNPVFDTGFAVVGTRHKVRGSGRAIQFRFECEEIGKDFDLLGWAAQIQGNTAP